MTSGKQTRCKRGKTVNQWQGRKRRNQRSKGAKTSDRGAGKYITNGKDGKLVTRGKRGNWDVEPWRVRSFKAIEKLLWKRQTQANTQ